MRTLKKSTAYELLVFMTSNTDHVTGKTGLGTGLTVYANKAGGGFSTLTITVAEEAYGWYQLSLTTSHTDTNGDLALHIVGDGTTDPTDIVLQVRDNVLGDTLPANVTQLGGVVQSLTDLKDFADTGYNPVTHLIVGLATDFDTLQIVDGKVQADAVSLPGTIPGAWVTSIWHQAEASITSGIGLKVKTNLDAQVSTRMATFTLPTNFAALGINVSGHISTVTTLTGHTAQTGDSFARIGATGSGLTTLATAANLTTALNDLDNIQTRLPAALVSGRIDASVGAMAANVITATAINADAITDAKVASDVTIASVTGSVGSVTGLTAADVNAIKLQTDKFVFTVANEVNSNARFWGGTAVASAVVNTNLIQILAYPIVTNETSGGNIGANFATFFNNGDVSPCGSVVDDLDNIQGRLPAALVSGRIDASVGAMAANVITATAINADAITDAKVASDVTIASVTGAVGSVTGLTAATVHSDLNDIQARLPASLSTGSNMKASFEEGTLVISEADAEVLAAIIATDPTFVDSFTKITNVDAAKLSVAAAGKLNRSAIGIVLGTVATSGANSPTNIVTSSLVPAHSGTVANQYKGRILIFDENTTTAALRCQATDITASTTAGVLTVTALTATPVNGDTFTIN